MRSSVMLALTDYWRFASAQCSLCRSDAWLTSRSKFLCGDFSQLGVIVNKGGITKLSASRKGKFEGFNKPVSREACPALSYPVAVTLNSIE